VVTTGAPSIGGHAVDPVHWMEGSERNIKIQINERHIEKQNIYRSKKWTSEK